MGMKAPTLNTDRMILRNISADDIDNIVKWRSDPEVYIYFLAPHPLTAVEHLLWYNESYIFNDNRFDWMACDKKDGCPIGVFGVRRDEVISSKAEVSYILAPEKRGKGFAKEGLIKIIEFLKNNWCCEIVVAEIHENNDKSIQFAKRLGFEVDSKNGCFITLSKKLK